MNVYIEFIIVLILVLMFFTWALWKNITDWYYKLRYNKQEEKKKDDDKYKREREEVGRGESDAESSVDDVPRPSELAEQELLPTTEVDSDGENSLSTGKSNFISRIKKD
jgi:hypothetical protein